MRKIHAIRSGDWLDQSMSRRGYYYWLAPCGGIGLIRGRRKDWLSGKLKERALEEWREAPPRLRCKRCEKAVGR